MAPRFGSSEREAAGAGWSQTLAARLAATRTLTPDRGDFGRRLDHVLRRHLRDRADATRTRVQSWIEDGRVTVNGRLAHRTAARIGAGDLVEMTLPEEPRPRRAGAEAIPVEILYEDAWLLAVNKPAGMVVHPTYRHTEGTLLSALLGRARDWPPGERPSILGRLDKLTSGLVLVARTAPIHTALQRLLASSRSGKEYLAVVHGRVNRARGTIDLPLARDPHDRRRVVVAQRMGSLSRTDFVRLDRTEAGAGAASLLRCRLVTGRMHQIRAHLAARGWPLVGDPVYGTKPRLSPAESARDLAIRSFPRQALHAWRLRVPHPVTGAGLVIEAPLPGDLTTLLEACGLRPRAANEEGRLGTDQLAGPAPPPGWVALS